MYRLLKGDESMKITKPFFGIIVPMITPLTPEGEIDVSSTKRLIDYLLDGGVHGLFLLGSAGEGPLLPSDMQRELIEVAVGHVAGHVPVLVGISDTSTAKCIFNSNVFKGLAVDCFVCTLPYYFGTTGEDQFRHFSVIAQNALKPIMIYDLPMRVKNKIETEIIFRLEKTPNIIGLKDSSGDIPAFRRIASEVVSNVNFTVLIGETRLIDVALFLGGDGTVSTDANVYPRECVAVYDAAVQGDWEKARAKQSVVNQNRLKLASRQRSGGGIDLQSVKQELAERKIIDSLMTMGPYVR
jgi:4-hydroxy-tetrahydrodipicolinate synthase